MKHLVLAVALGVVALSPAAGHAQQPTNVSQKPMGDVSGVHGWIEDAIAHNPGAAHDDVVKAVAGGAPLVFVDDKSKRVYTIDNPEAVKGHEGHHVAFTGGIDSINKSIHVKSISMLKNQKPGAAADAVGH